MDKKLNGKKALWIPEDLHKIIKMFAVENDISIEEATQILVKLGICSYKAEHNND